MNYSTEKINQEIKALAIKIKNEVPYWMHYRPVLALKQSLKDCQDLESSENNSNVLQINKSLIIECLRILKNENKSID